MLSQLYTVNGNVTNEWSHTSIPPYAFIACTVTAPCYFTLIPRGYQRFGGKYCLLCQGRTSEWRPRFFRKFRHHLPNCSVVWRRISQNINLCDWCNIVTWPTHQTKRVGYHRGTSRKWQVWLVWRFVCRYRHGLVRPRLVVAHPQHLAYPNTLHPGPVWSPSGCPPPLHADA